MAATRTMLSAELADPQRLTALLEAALPPDWPPEHHDRETLEFWHEQLARPRDAGWWLHYVLLMSAGAPTLVGTVAFKGPPANSTVEIGYSVVPSWRRRGVATEAVRELIEAAWERGLDTVIAHTFPDLEPSLGVLRKLGFKPSGRDEAGELEFRLRRG